jgi:signal transduction histidine kinase/DNA-binding response OmpR family regulator/ligand-binding sensor domain-containing protein
MMIRGTAVFLFLLTAFSVSVQSQEMIPGFSNRHWTVDDGLPSNEVNSIVQDTQGYIWFSTFNGLVRFDGNSFTVFNTSGNPELKSNRFEWIKSDPSGGIWFVTGAINQKDYLYRYKNGELKAFEFERNAGSLNMWPQYYQGKLIVNNNYTVYQFNGSTFSPLDIIPADLKVRRIFPLDNPDVIWITTDEGVARINSNGEITKFTTEDGLLNSYNFSLYVDHFNRVWVSGEGGVNYIQDDSVYAPEQLNILLKNHTVSEIVGDKSNPNRVIFELNGDSLLFLADEKTQFVPPFLTDSGGRSGEFSLITSAKDGSPKNWLKAENKLFYNSKMVYEAGSTSEIRGYLETDDGGVWIGKSDGLHFFSKNTFSSFTREISEAPNMYPLYQTKDDVVYAGNLNDGLFTYVNGEWSKGPNVDLSRVFSFLEDSKGRVWVGNRAGIHLIGTKSGEINAEILSAGIPVPIAVKAMYENFETGEILFGSFRGIDILNNRGEWSRLAETKKRESLGEVRTITKTKDGAIWIGTNGQGLFYIRDGEVNLFEANEKLSDSIIRSFYQDDDGIIWVGMENGGLNRLEIKNADHSEIDVTVYNTSNGLFDDIVHVILEDDYGRLWMSGNKGIFWVSRDNLNAFARGEISRIQSEYYLDKDGLPGNEANGGMQHTGIKNSDGTFWFSMVNGIAVVNPDDVPNEYEPTLTFIESLGIKDSTITNPSEPLILAKHQRDIQLTYTGFNYRVEPENIQFRYRLNGANNNEWVESGNRREAFFTNLSAGEYTFTVQASTDGTRWENSNSSVSFTILPFFYETNWFMLLMILGGMGLIYSGFKWRTRKLYERQQELSTLVNERTNDLILEKNEVERQKEIIEKLSHSKDRFFANISHELRTPLTLVLGPLKQLQETSEIKEEKLKHMLSIAGKNGMRLQELVEQVLDVTRLDSGTIKPNFESLDILEYLNLITESFQSQTIKKGVALTSELPAGTVIIMADKDKVQKIVVNLISNALKFTLKGGSILVSLNDKKEEVELKITDTGIGIEADRLSLIFDRFHSNDRSDLKSGDGLGIGLHLTKELVDLHHGNITVESELGKGSTFTVVLPKMQASVETPIEEDSEASDTEIDLSLSEVIRMPAISYAKAAVTNILLVEDNEDMRSYISGLLTSDIVKVTEAENGIEGKKKLIELTPDLIISDVMMPDMDGFEFARFVRSKPEYRLTPLVILTALSGLDDRIEAFDIGVSDYLNKPFNETELKVRIANLLALKAEREEAINYMGEGEEPGDSEDVQNLFIETLRAFVKERISESEITSDDLCQAVNMSRRQLFRKIKTETGFTPGAFVREIKLLEARKLIEERKGNTVSEISYAVGFSTPSHFAKIFEERFGTHPKELLK